MRGMLAFCAALLVAYCATAAAEPLPGQFRGSTRALEQIAPSTAWYDTTLTTSASSDDSVYFGFEADLISIYAKTADVTVTPLIDTSLPRGALAAGADTLQFASTRGAAGALPRITQNGFLLAAGEVYSWPVRWSGVRIEGGGTGSCIIQVSGSPLRGGN